MIFSQLLNNQDSVPEGELDLLSMFEGEFLHEGFRNIEPPLAVSSDINPSHVLDFHYTRMHRSIINLPISLQNRKDYILHFPYISVRSDKGWVTS